MLPCHRRASFSGALQPRRRTTLVHGASPAVLAAALAVALLSPSVARAGTAEDASTTVRLIQLLIQQGILTQGQAASLLTQAGAGAAPTGAAHRRHGAGAAARAEPASAAVAAPIAPPGEVRVTYVPQFVRDQIATEVRTQVMQQAQTEGWAKPDQVPDWIHRLTLYGDFRMRYQADLFDKGNIATTGPLAGFQYPFLNVAAINAAGGFDTNGSGIPPILNVSQNRSLYRIRARLGVHAQINDWISSDVRIATGNDPSPVSENQTLGRPGDFQKYGVYVDQAYMKFRPTKDLTVFAGRAPDPYFVTDLMYYRELNFDGVTARYDPKLSRQFGVFLIGGAYPVFNTDLNFSSTSLTKGSSHDAYLLAAQAGVEWKSAHDYAATLGAGYFAYSNITGKESAPCLLLSSTTTCSTDNTIPSFQTFGNTVFPVRNLVTNTSAIPAMPQLYGLASHFGILDVHGRFDVKTFDPVVVSLEGEYVDNLAYSRSYILARNPQNNFGSNGLYQGGNTGYLARLSIGMPDVERLWDWNFSLAYKSVASDAVLDALTDPDFHLGGTNAKGYVIGGALGLAQATTLNARWLSASEVSGPPFRVDVLQVDLNTKF